MDHYKNNPTPQDRLTSTKHINRILYATDLTESSPRVYQYVLYLAKQLNAEIVCLHVIDKFSHNTAMTFAGYYLTAEDRQTTRRRETTRALNEMAHRNRQTFIQQQPGIEDGLFPDQLDVKIENKVVFGNIEEQILFQSGNLNCDHVVMGAHEKPLFTFTTTLSKRVMKRSSIPVTVVPLLGERKERSRSILPSFLPQFSATQCK